MTEHNLFYYPYASFTNSQLPLLKLAALYFDKLVLLDPVGVSWKNGDNCRRFRTHSFTGTCVALAKRDKNFSAGDM